MNKQFSFFFLLCFIFCSAAIEAQNLVINPSFENIVACPDAFEQIENSLTWTNATATKADYFHECDGTNTVGIPANSVGFQSARTGSAYAGLQVYSTGDDVNYREYLQIPLVSPLIADSIYEVSMYVSPADNLDDCFTDAIGFYLSDELVNENQQTHLDIIPRVQNSAGNFLIDKGNWILISGTFTAIGEESHLVIGNFLNDAQTEVFAACQEDETAYYYVDDVSVELIPELSIVGDDFICVGETTVLQAVNGSSFEWTTTNEPNTVVSTGEFFSVSPTSTTTYQVFDGTNTASFTLTVQQNPEINLTDETVVCESEIVILDATPINISESVTYLWMDQSTNPTFEVQDAGTYSVDVTINGCTFRESVSLDSGFSFEVDFGEDQILCDGESIVLRPFMTDGIIPNLSYLWQDDSTSSEFMVSEAGTYSVTVTNGCFTETDEVIVTSRECDDCLVTFPSAFSPNEDGINDSFQPVSNCEINNYKLSIFTRYGNEIFTSNEITNGWDGMIDLKAADLKTYVWVASYQITANLGEETLEEMIQKGTVLLLK